MPSSPRRVVNTIAPGPLFMASILVLGAFAAFILPLLIPVGAQPIYSTAWVAGADNRAATLGLAIVSVAVLLATLLRQRNHSANTAPSPKTNLRLLTRTTLVAASLLVALWTLAWGFAILRSGLRVGETNYFLEQTRNAAGIGLPAPMHIYRDLEFPYGPLLLYPPIWLWRLIGRAGLSLAACYVVTLTLFNVAGIFFVWYSLNRLPLALWARRLFFAISVFEALHPLFGPNYSLGKFALPLAVLVWGSRVHTPVRRACALAFGLFLAILVSPELGVGLSAGIVAMSLLSAYRAGLPERRGWLLALLAPVAGYTAFLLLYGPAFLIRLRHASGGALNLLIQPLPDLLVFCFAIVWLAPIAVGLSLRTHGAVAIRAGQSEPWNAAPLLLGIFVLALGLLPGALGRSDPLHVFFNGLPFLLLSLVAIERLPRRGRLLWAAALVILALQVQAANFEMYARSLRDVVRAQRHPQPTTFDVARLAAATAGQPVAAPVLYGIPIPDELALRRAHLLLADPAPGLAEIWDAPGEQAHIARLRQSRWALLPDEDYLVTERLPGSAPTRTLSAPQPVFKRLLRQTGHAILGFSYPQRHTPFSVGLLTRQEIAANWNAVGHFGRLTLYQRVR